MRWVSFAILLLVVLALQSAAAPFVAVHTVQPDFLIIVAVYYGLTARTYDALFACWIIGLAIDLTGLGFQQYSNVGIHALVLGLIGAGLVKLRELFFRDSVMTQILLTFIGKWAMDAAVGLHMILVVDLPIDFSEIATRGFHAAAYSAALAPYGFWFLRGLRNTLGLGAPERLRVR